MLKRHAIVVLPPASLGLVRDTGLRKWLSRGHLALTERGPGPLNRVLQEIGAPGADAGLAALRYWGQTGAPPAGWVAAADPVSLRPRMRDIVVNALPAALLPDADLQEVYESVGLHVAAHDGLLLERIGHGGYLFSDAAFATPTVSADAVDGCVPDALETAPGNLDLYRRLDSELQMLLHAHPVNVRRQQQGMPPINGLWLSQGGKASGQARYRLPRLYSGDPLFSGYWLSRGCEPGVWQGSLLACASAADGGFVAVAPQTDERTVDAWLHDSRELLDGGALKSLSLYFRDGLCAKLKRRDRFRRWRTIAPVLEEQSPHD